MIFDVSFGITISAFLLKNRGKRAIILQHGRFPIHIYTFGYSLYLLNVKMMEIPMESVLPNYNRKEIAS